MSDSAVKHELTKEDKQKKAINLALKLPAGRINSETPLRMIAQALLTKGMDKTSSIHIGSDTLCPVMLNRFLNTIHEQWHTWEPDTVLQTLGEHAPIEGPSSLLNDKIRAIQICRDPSVCGNIGFDADMFEKLCIVFNNMVPEFSIWELPSLKVIRYGYMVIKAINPDIELWDDVYAYIQALMQEEGLLFFPMGDIDVKIASEYTGAVEQAWNSLSGLPIEGLMDFDEADTVIGVQMQKLIDISAYCAVMMG